MTASPVRVRARDLAVYFALGLLFGVVLVRSEAVSWFRMQEMFRLQGPKMYLIFATAIPTAMLSLALIRRAGLRALDGTPIVVPPKTLGTGRRYVIGGAIFGAGWALTGACPGPMFALLGSGVSVLAVVLASALLGTWLYGWLRPRLPH